MHALRRRFGKVARILAPLLPEGRLRERVRALAGSDAEYLEKAIYRFDGMFDPRFRARHGHGEENSSDPLAAQVAYFRNRQDWDGVSLTLGAAFEWKLSDDLLQRADRIGMSHSLELRCPFLDAAFVDYCSRLPLDSKVRAEAPEPRLKIALKLAFKDILPRGIACQRKKGFPMPIYDWLTTVYEDLVIEELRRSDTWIAEVFSERVRLEVFEKARRGDLMAKERLWLMVYLNRWTDAWLKTPETLVPMRRGPLRAS